MYFFEKNTLSEAVLKKRRVKIACSVVVLQRISLLVRPRESSAIEVVVQTQRRKGANEQGEVGDVVFKKYLPTCYNGLGDGYIDPVFLAT